MRGSTRSGLQPERDDANPQDLSPGGRCSQVASARAARKLPRLLRRDDGCLVLKVEALRHERAQSATTARARKELGTTAMALRA